MPRRHPQPEFRQHRTVLEGDFAPGATILQGATARIAIPCASAQTLRIRLKLDRAGTMAGSFLLPGTKAGEEAKFDVGDDLSTAAKTTSGNPSNVAVTANVEALMEVDVAGEAWFLLEYTEGGAGDATVDQLSYSQL